jgi:cob(I)alamin adenosyltransferase
MKIYTRNGDKGKTSLLGETEVPKNDYRLEAYGTIDELISWLGLIHSQNIDQHDKSVIFKIQGMLMNVSSHVGNEKETLIHVNMPDDADVKWIEGEIDRIEELVPPLKSFIIPGGHTIVSYCHLARCVCRRAERRLIPVLQNNEEVGLAAVKFLNRLSDYLFMLCRKISSDLNCEEKIWNPLP